VGQETNILPSDILRQSSTDIEPSVGSVGDTWYILGPSTGIYKAEVIRWPCRFKWIDPFDSETTERVNCLNYSRMLAPARIISVVYAGGGF